MLIDHSLGDVVSKIVGQVTSPSPEPNTESALPSSVGELMSQEQFPMQHCGHGVHQPSNPYPVSNHHTSSISSINSNVDSLAADTQSPSDSLNFPISGMVISDVKNWHDVVWRWEIGDASTMALKDWPKEWYQGGMKMFTGSLYSQRKMIMSMNGV